MTEIKIIHKYLKAQHLHAEPDITQIAAETNGGSSDSGSRGS
jgi:hypothetical protein